MTDTLTDMVSPEIDEHLVAIQWFYPRDRWKTGPLSFRRLARSLLGSSRLDDALPLQSILALTPTRVLVFGAGTSTGAFALTGLIAEWPRASVTASRERVDLTTVGFNSSGTGYGGRSSNSKKFTRLLLQTPDGELGADLPDRERATQAVIKQLVS
jgi:hypothetical protein